MSISEIHPEDLFDKLSLGTLSEHEAEHLRTHLKECAACRLELQLREDLEVEASGLLVPDGLQSTPPRRSAPPAVRPARRRRAWVLMAALVVTATGALAAMNPGLLRLEFLDTSAKATDARVQTAEGASAARLSERRARVEATRVEHKEAAPKAIAIDEIEPQPSGERGAAAAQPGAAFSVARAGVRRPARVEAQPVTETEPLPSAARLFADANRLRRVGDRTEAMRLYQQLQGRYPASSEALLSLVTLATLRLDSGDAHGALAGFNRYLALGGGALEAESLFGRANALQRLGRSAEEAKTRQRLIAKYPDSAYARRAMERLAQQSEP